MNPSRIFPLLLIVLAHVLVLRVANGIFFQETLPVEVAPVTLYPPPAVSKLSPKKQPAKPPARPVKVATPPLPKAAPDELATLSEGEPVLHESVEVSEPQPEKIAELEPALTTLPPPSAHYALDVTRTEPKLTNPYYGSGNIYWHHDDNHYTMQIEVGIELLFTSIRLYDIQSSGTIENDGIKPLTVTETRRGKSVATTHFNYDSSTISFSENSAANTALLEGAQDKATVFMQLASIGNADPTQFEQGKKITIQVAEEKEANPHQFVVLDQETINTKLGQLTAWHLTRPPRPGSYSSRLDVWLAPEFHWLPVQIRNTESNGAITTQTIRQINKGSQS